MNGINPDKERRQAVRITGRNLFSYSPIEKDKYEEIAQDFAKGMSPYNQEGLTDIQIFVNAQSALARLREKDSDLAEFLQHLDNKINQILVKIDDGKTLFDDLVLQEFNMSGDGLGFIVDEQLEPGTILEFHIVLLPDYCYIYCLGKIVDCREMVDKDDKTVFRISCEFVLIMDNDRENLIQHNFRQQSLALRNRKRKP
jgi:hypothetical protein